MSTLLGLCMAGAVAPVLAQGHFWLSETPDRPSMGWDGRCCKRIASWAQLKDQRTGKAFFVFNAHFARVLRYGVLSDSHLGRFPSDHHPVAVRLQLD